MTIYKFLNILFALVLVFAYGNFAMAQDFDGEQGEGASDFVYDPILGAQDKESWMERQRKDERYAETTYENLSKMYWAIYALELSDDEAIDNYLRINECDLWEKYYHNDFQWEEIREATRRLIAKERHTFPRRFEILLPLSLGRYDIEREVFEIEDVTKFKHMKKINIALAASDNLVCHSAKFVTGYPGAAILILDRPFHFVEIPVKPELARLYIKEAEEKYENMAADLKMRIYERQAFLRVLVSFNSYVNSVFGSGNVRQAVIHAKVDAIEVYADSKNTKPLYIKDFSEIRKRRKDRAIDSTTNDDIDKAFQGLLTPEEDGSSGSYLQ